MFEAVRIADGVHWLGVNDRDTELFEGLWPLPDGMAYNAYLVAGEKVALIDAVKGLYSLDFVTRLRSVLGPRRGVDYLVVNHLEPDHSGALRAVLAAFPEVEVVGSPKTVEFARHLHGVTEGVRAVADGEILDLGGKRLQFFLTPMVHWPETMMTYEPGHKILFSGDAFGGYGGLGGAVFDDETADRPRYELEMLRYYANIVAKYSPMVQKALERLKGIDLAIVAPSHGLLWRGDPGRAVGLYDRWSRQETEPAAVVAYGSMYGNTAKMAEELARGLSEAGVADVRVLDLSRTHASYALAHVWRARALALGTPTYNLGVYPPVEGLTRFLEDKRLENRVLGVFGTYGWSGGGVRKVREFAERARWELVEPVVEARFAAKEEDLGALRRQAQGLAKRILA